jgi:hypothetical protein
VSPPVHENQLSKSNKLDAEAIWLYGLPHGILHVFNTILYENEFQNPQILMDTLEIA